MKPKVDYTIRPAKNIERKMIVESLAKLSIFQALKKYKYVGLGALYFSDFKLMHRSFAMREMISIEENSSIGRFKSNKPYRSIRIQNGHCCDELPLVNWKDKRAIVWLDFEDKLDASKLSDITLLVDRLRSGSVFLITVNVSKEKNFPGGKKEFLKRIGGTSALPVGVTVEEEDLNKSTGHSKLAYESINMHVEKALLERNKGKNALNRLNYKQIFHFRYRDGSPMLTVGGVIYSNRDAAKFNSAAFNTLDHYMPGNRFYSIKPPKLTYKEIRDLDRKLPATGARPKLPGVSKQDINEYEKVYRYFPKFVDADL